MQKLKPTATLVVIVFLPFFIGVSGASETKPVKPPATVGGDKSSSDGKGVVAAKEVKKPDQPLYRPPLRGAPAGRIGGGTRGISDRESFSLKVLVPDHVGLTVSDQPSLYWFISKPTTYAVELTVIERNAITPLVERLLKGPERGGIQVARLADFGVHLRPNVQYKWFVTLVTDADQRSKDILAGGIISLVNPSSALLSRLKGADGEKAPLIYAEEGIWYDALDRLSELIDAAPGNADLRRQRAALLEQVGLGEAAEF